MAELIPQPEQPQQNQLIALAKDLGYTGELSPGALEDGIRSAMRRTIEDVLELGARLLLLKEATGHGEFSKRIELLGLSSRMCQKFMSATQKFSKANSKAVLNVVGTQTKLLELLVLDDEEIEAIANGESIGDLNLDEIECMSVSELKAALRDRTARLDDMTNAESRQVKVLKADIEHKASIIDSLTQSDHRTYHFDLQTHLVREECLAHQAEFELALNSLRQLFEDCINDDYKVERDLRIEQVWVTLHVAAARAMDAIAYLQSFGLEGMPQSIGIDCMLKEDEAYQWRNDYETLQGQHLVNKAKRQEKREAEKPKGPGRPRKDK